MPLFVKQDLHHVIMQLVVQIKQIMPINSLSANPIKWSNTLKEFLKVFIKCLTGLYI